MTYPKCSRCGRIFAAKALLDEGMCYECVNAPPMYVSMLIWGAVVLCVIALCAIAGCSDGQDVMKQYRSGNFHLAGELSGYSEYREFLESEENYE